MSAHYPSQLAGMVPSQRVEETTYMTNRHSANRGEEAAAMPQPQLWPRSARVDLVGRLTLAGLDVAALARKYGTPLYVYDEATIRAQCHAFRAAFATRWPQSSVAYASKAYLSLALC